MSVACGVNGVVPVPIASALTPPESRGFFPCIKHKEV